VGHGGLVGWCYSYRFIADIEAGFYVFVDDSSDVEGIGLQCLFFSPLLKFFINNRIILQQRSGSQTMVRPVPAWDDWPILNIHLFSD